MDKRINKKLESYITKFKNDIKDKAIELNINKDPKTLVFIQFICDYENLVLNKEDFMKRKRVKNVIHLNDRCSAKRASGEQCTRRRKDDSEYCGTHIKGTPHGIIDNSEEEVKTTEKIEIWGQDFQGIIYYIDKYNNVYQAEDIISNKPNPKVIAKYVKNDNEYTIPEFNL